MGRKTFEQEKVITNLENFYKSRENVFNFLETWFWLKSKTGLKILTPNQTLERLPIALAQLKAGNNWENLLNEIRQNCLFFVSVKRNHQKSIQ